MKKTSSKNDETYIKRFLSGLFPSAVLTLLLLVIVPLDTVLSNQKYLALTPSMFFWKFLVVALILSCVGASILAIFRGVAFRFLVCSVSGICLALFLQLLFFNTGLPTLDGTKIDLSSRQTAVILNWIVWGIIILLPFLISVIFRVNYKSVILIVCLSVFSAQTVSVVSQAITADDSRYNESFVLNGYDQYTVSSKENILVFSLDFLSRDLFDTILETYPETQQEYKDFLYFNNVCGSYDATFPSLCALYTGYPYDGSLGFSDYFDTAWNSEKANSFYSFLHEKGYKNMIFAEPEYCAGYVGNMSGKIDNVIRGKKQLTSSAITRLLRIVCYRALPLGLKPSVIVISDGRPVTADAINEAIQYSPDEPGIEYVTMELESRFYVEMQERGIKIENDFPVYSWSHLLGAHGSYTLNEYGMPGDPTDYVIQTRGFLFAIARLMDSLKENGVYDDTAIIITADHGWDEQSFVPVLIKPFHTMQDSMRISSVPASQKDIMPTIVELLGEDSSPYGRSVYSYSENEDPERTYMRLAYSDAYADPDSFHYYGQNNILKKYTFHGDQNVLIEKWKNDDCENVKLKDSFY